MWLERDTDAKMERTRKRPLPAGRLAPNVALAFGIALALVSLPILALGVNAMTGLLGAVALVSYVLMYTPMKRHSSRALWVGAVPGAIPPLLGWAAVTGSVTAPGLSLFAILFVWQIPHFIAISIFRADDYTRAGLKVVPVEFGERATNGIMTRYAVLLFALTYWPFFAKIGGYGYLGIATLLGLAFVAACAVGYRKRTVDGQRNRWARGVFAFSILYLVALFVALVAGA
jgi:protoheme IX farnesyltransferase